MRNLQNEGRKKLSDISEEEGLKTIKKMKIKESTGFHQVLLLEEAI